MTEETAATVPAATDPDRVLRDWIARLKTAIETKHSGIDRGFDHLWSEIRADEKLIGVLERTRGLLSPVSVQERGAEGEPSSDVIATVLTALASAFQCPDASARGSAAFVVRDIAGSRAVPVLRAQLDRETNDAVRADLEIAIKSVAAREVDPILRALRSGTSEERLKAISQLRNTDDAEGLLPALEQALSDPDPKVRAAALSRYAGLAKGSDRLLDLARRAANDAETKVRSTAVFMLLESGLPNPALLDVLGAALVDQDDFIRFVALKALREERADTSALPLLYRALEDPRTRETAAEILRDYAAVKEFSIGPVPDRVAGLAEDLAGEGEPYPTHKIAGDLAVFLAAAGDSHAPALLAAFADRQETKLRDAAMTGRTYLEAVSPPPAPRRKAVRTGPQSPAKGSNRAPASALSVH